MQLEVHVDIDIFYCIGITCVCVCGERRERTRVYVCRTQTRVDVSSIANTTEKWETFSIKGLKTRFLKVKTNLCKFKGIFEILLNMQILMLKFNLMLENILIGIHPEALYSFLCC